MVYQKALLRMQAALYLSSLFLGRRELYFVYRATKLILRSANIFLKDVQDICYNCQSPREIIHNSAHKSWNVNIFKTYGNTIHVSRDGCTM
jgi:hypothetical protein